MKKRRANTVAGIVAILLMQVLCTFVLLRAQQRAGKPEAANVVRPLESSPLATFVPAQTPDTPNYRRLAAEEDISALDSALQMYYCDTGHFPKTEEGLTALVRNVAHEPNWKGPYLHNESNIRPDPWGHRYRYRKPGPPGSGFLIASEGDGEAITTETLKRSRQAAEQARRHGQ